MKSNMANGMVSQMKKTGQGHQQIDWPESKNRRKREEEIGQNQNVTLHSSIRLHIYTKTYKY